MLALVVLVSKGNLCMRRVAGVLVAPSRHHGRGRAAPSLHHDMGRRAARRRRLRRAASLDTSRPTGARGRARPRHRSLRRSGGRRGVRRGCRRDPPVSIYLTSGGRLLLTPPVTLLVALGLMALARRRRRAACRSSPRWRSRCTPRVVLALQQVVATPLHYVHESLTSPTNLAGLLRGVRRRHVAGAAVRRRSTCSGCGGCGCWPWAWPRRPADRRGDTSGGCWPSMSVLRHRRGGVRGARRTGDLSVTREERRSCFARSGFWSCSCCCVAGGGAAAVFARRGDTGHHGHGRNDPEARPRGDRLGVRQDRSEEDRQHQRPDDGPRHAAGRATKAIASRRASSCCRSIRSTPRPRCAATIAAVAGARTALEQSKVVAAERARQPRARAPEPEAPAGAVGPRA